MVSVFVPTERDPHETRVAATPESVQKLLGLGLNVVVERGAGGDAFIGDAAFEEAGAEIVDEAATGYAKADLILKVQPLSVEEAGLVNPGATVVSFLVASDREAEV
ncbi:MAG: NAD(P)(+) transhydrogenase (Re/Si-specific) subunit alpha, partial [Proteobacteria bacterium]